MTTSSLTLMSSSVLSRSDHHPRTKTGRCDRSSPGGKRQIPKPFSPAAFGEVVDALHREDGVLIGGAYGGPSSRQPFGDAKRALRFVTHLQTPRATAGKALLGGLTRLLKVRR